MCRSQAWTVAALAGAFLAACSPEATDSDVRRPLPHTEAQAAALSGPVTRSQALANASQWVAAQLPYCQSANGQPDDDAACAPVCTRQSNPEWDPYRSDCSGFISWSWELPPPGLVTGEYAPFDTTASYTIDCLDLQPGDAANRDPNTGHIVLFEQWVTPGQEALFMEEPGCSSAMPYAHEFDSTLTCSGSTVTIDYEADTFTAIRYVNIVDDPDGGCASSAAACSADGDCCDGLTCQSGICQAAPTCTAIWGGCTSAAECCSDMACLTWTPAGESAGTYCCDAVGAACSDSRECCGGTLCDNGICACVPEDTYCQNDADCCAGLACDSASSTCQPAPTTGGTSTTTSATSTTSGGTSSTTAATTAASTSSSGSSSRPGATSTSSGSSTQVHLGTTAASTSSGSSGSAHLGTTSSSTGGGSEAGGPTSSIIKGEGGCAAADGDPLLGLVALGLGRGRYRRGS